MITASATGKLFIAGEWAVLEPGNPCIVAAINRRVYCEAGESKEIEVSVDDFSIRAAKAAFDRKLRWEPGADTEKLKFAGASIEAALSYIGEWEPFRLRTHGDRMSQKEGKFGFGSSAAACSSIIGAILALHGHAVTTKQGRETVFKLASIAHYIAQGKSGSGADIAASVYGGAVVYKRYNAAWLDERMKSGAGIKAIADEGWPGLEAENLALPEKLRMVVGWSGKPAETPPLIKEMGAFKLAKPDEYRSHMDGISSLVKRMIAAWQDGKWHDVISLANENHRLLAGLGEASGVPIETRELKELAGIAMKENAGGKLSGAGGGDCAIALCFGSETAKKVKAEWKARGYEVPEVGIDPEGLRVE